MCPSDSQMDRRQYFRLNLSSPLCSKMGIIQVYNKTVNTKTARVCIQDIGPGGLRFLSSLQFPINPAVILGFELTLLGQVLHVNGNIVRIKEREDGIWEYGVKFILDENNRSKLIETVNRLSISVHKDLRFLSSNFCVKKDIIRCLRSQST
jgi:hypothetical protein